jgi:hypothetical protein
MAVVAGYLSLDEKIFSLLVGQTVASMCISPSVTQHYQLDGIRAENARNMDTGI